MYCSYTVVHKNVALNFLPKKKIKKSIRTRIRCNLLAVDSN